MYNVSLLPNEYRALNKLARKKDATLLIAIVIMCCFLLAYLVISIVSINKDSMLKEAEAKDLVLENKIALLLDLEKLNDDVKKQSNQMQTAVGTTPVWADLVATIGNAVKPYITITSIDTSYEKDIGECAISGISYDYDSVSMFIEELEAIPEIENVKCSFSNQVYFENDSASSFDITFNILSESEYQLPLEVFNQ